MKRQILAASLLVAGLAAGCQDLDVVNSNAPDRERALSSAADVETLILSTFRDLWTRWHGGSSTYNAVPVISDAFTATYANDAALELSSEPRPPFNNNPLSDAHGVARFPWETWYRAISSANDGLFAINDGLEIETGEPVTDNTQRTKAFAMWSRAIAHGYLASMYDKNFFVREDADFEDPLGVPLIEYPASLDSALVLIDEALVELARQPFTLPATWINGYEYTNTDLAKMLNSFAARFLVYSARTPEERQNLNWDRVLSYLDKGITSDAEVMLESGVLTSGFLSRLQQSGTFSAWGDYKAIGPADVSGAYKTWLDTPLQDRVRFHITTPDRRLTGTTPTSNGNYFRYRSDNIFRPERGTYHHSHYQWRRNGGRSVSGTYAWMSVDEMNLLRAEAYFFKGDLDRAAQYINMTRTRATAGLPAVTRDGVPPSASCVPRMDGVTCGTLHQALVYERMMENMALDALIAYQDSRGLGRLPPGTFLMLPIPGRELEALGLPIYSFGGVGGPGAAQ